MVEDSIIIDMKYAVYETLEEKLLHNKAANQTLRPKFTLKPH